MDEHQRVLFLQAVERWMNEFKERAPDQYQLVTDSEYHALINSQGILRKEWFFHEELTSQIRKNYQKMRQ